MDKKESAKHNELKKLEKIGVREISKATHIQEEHIQSILNQEFDKLLDCNAVGFIKILERDYDVDLSWWLDEFNKIKGETKPRKTVIDRQVSIPNFDNRKKPNLAVWFLLLLLLILSVIYFGFYDLIKKPIDEFLSEKKIDYLNSQVVNQAEESLVSVGVEMPKFDENYTLIVPDKIFTNLDENETNTSGLNALDLSIKMKNAEFDTSDDNGTEFDENLTLPSEIYIIPSSKIWIGTIDLQTGKKWDAITSEKIVLDLNKTWLVITGHGHFTIDDGNAKQELKEKEKVRLFIKDKNISFIDNSEFMRLNGGKSW